MRKLGLLNRIAYTLFLLHKENLSIMSMFLRPKDRKILDDYDNCFYEIWGWNDEENEKGR